MAYTKRTWQDAPSTATPLNAANLNHLETQYDEAVQYVDGEISGLNKSDVGLSNVDNTSDASKPISTATASALAAKSDLTHGHALTDANITGVLPVAQLPSASTTARGGVELATTAETTTGTDAIRAVTPSGLKAVADAKAPLSHTHTSSEITDFTTSVNSIIDAGEARNSLFNYLRAGCVNVAQDTRVVVLGSSTAVGGYTSHVEQGVFQRLAARAGSAAFNDLNAVTTNQTPAGMKWWTGALGGTTSANYADATKRAKVAQVAPHYVFHMIGSNDWRNSVAPATYKENVLTVLNAIESATPGAINVLIQQQGRRDFAPTYSWDSYGTALRELAEANPTRRVFIDTTDQFRPLGVETDNRGGIVTSDLVHMGDVGHRYMANILSAETGIPSSDDFAGTTMMEVPMPASASYGPSAVVVTVPIGKANYPRAVRLEGPVYITVATAGAANEVMGELVNTSDSSLIKRIRHRVPAALTGAHTAEMNAIFYAPPNIDVSVLIRIGAASTVTVSGSAEYAEPRVIVDPI